MRKNYRKIVIVDDEKIIISMLNEFLSPKFTVYSAVNGREALELADAIRPDIILMDVVMPVMDGFEACQRIKENENTKDIPILLVTAKVSEADSERGLRCGADAYVSKPFCLENLMNKIEYSILKAEMQGGTLQ